MSADRPLDVVLMWHMHQPQYRTADGGYRQPWTYLHAMKDYTDIAAHLEAHPRAQSVVNFTPVLLDQLLDYADQFATNRFRDRLLIALAARDLDTLEDRTQLRHSLFRANRERMIERSPRYQALYLLDAAVRAHGEDADLSERFFGDLLVWYHLSWLGEAVRRDDPRVRTLLAKERDFSYEDRRLLLGVLQELIGGILPRFAALAQAGRVELSTSPFTHPIMPLLLDFASARDAMPDVPLPQAAGYPGGAARVVDQLRKARALHERCFGMPPAGLWPSEAGVSDETVALCAQEGFLWIASGENVLANSLLAQDPTLVSVREGYLYRAYRLRAVHPAVTLFFRDVHLSDRIGFEYASWHADDAVENFAAELERIRAATAHDNAPITSVILDGENAWEYYPENGYYFLRQLYDRLVEMPGIRLTTFSEHLQRVATEATLEHVVAGSWVYGTFSTWIGSPEKNRAWEMLVAAKRAYDEALPRLDPKRAARAEELLAVCEASDWFWWYAEHNAAETVEEFDRLYRAHLSDLYAALELPAPPELTVAIGRGHGAPAAGGTMIAGAPA
ncbi:MAG: glycoside hydrolase [Vulcanimicrobiaceae bacterium]